MKNRIEDLVEIIHDLSEQDEMHLLLEPYEVAALRILKTTGNMSFSMLSPEGKTDGNEIMIEYTHIQPYLLQLYVDIVLITKYVGVNDFTEMDLSGRMKDLKDTFGLKLVVLMQNTIGALLEGLEKENAVLFGASLKLLHAFVFSILDMYNVPEDHFYDSVEEHVYFTLAENSKDYVELSTNKLKMQFKGDYPVTLSVKIDKRKRVHFDGFRVTLGDKTTVVFKNASPYKAFLEATNYINDNTLFKDVKFHMDIKTKVFLNNYSIMYAKEDQLVEKMEEGFYPVLVPKGVTDMSGFLDALTK